MQLSPLLLHFQSLHPFPVYNWHPFSCCPGSCSHSGKGCVHSRTMGPFQWIFLRDQQLLPPPQPPLFFTARSYEVLFPSAGTLGGVVWPGDGISCFPDVSPHQFLSATCECRTTRSVSPLPPCHCHTVFSLPGLHGSAPPTCLDEYFFFKSSVVGLPYSSIFCQF